jgi:hypothetical protein
MKCRLSLGIDQLLVAAVGLLNQTLADSSQYYVGKSANFDAWVCSQ